MSSVSITGATFAYPTDKPTFNYIDKVFIVYTTPWHRVNMTVFCQDTISVSTDPDYYQTYYNPLVQNGNYTIDEIGNPDDLTGILEFPTLCWFELEDAGGSGQTSLGGNFTMSSTSGPKKTWGYAVSPTRSQTSATQSSSISSSEQTQTSSGLGTGAKAGIGLGFAIAGLLIAVLVFYNFRQRQQLAKIKQSSKCPFSHQDRGEYKTELPEGEYRTELPGNERHVDQSEGESGGVAPQLVR